MSWHEYQCPDCGCQLAPHKWMWDRQGQYIGRAWCSYCKDLVVITISKEKQLSQIRAEMDQFLVESFGDDFGEWEQQMGEDNES